VPEHLRDINDELTIENMFMVYDKKAGAYVDVREIMDITEEDFKENPELLDIIKQMNETNPVLNTATSIKPDESEMSMSNPEYYISHSKQMSVPIGSKLDISYAASRGVSQNEMQKSIAI
jgi:hypothetical protein